MNAMNEKEIAAAIAQIKACGNFTEVRHKTAFDATTETIAGTRRVLVEVLDAGKDGSEPRFVVNVTPLQGGGTKPYSGRGQTIAEAVEKVSWMDLLT